MDLEKQIEMATTGNELVLIAETAKLTIPDGWGKMGIDRKKRWVLTALAQRPKVGTITHVAPGKTGMLAAAAGALTRFGKGLKKPKPAVNDNAAPEKPKGPSRQVRRSDDRRRDKLVLAEVKRQAMKDNRPGGAAGVTMELIKRKTTTPA